MTEKKTLLDLLKATELILVQHPWIEELGASLSLWQWNKTLHISLARNKMSNAVFASVCKDFGKATGGIWSLSIKGKEDWKYLVGEKVMPNGITIHLEVSTPYTCTPADVQAAHVSAIELDNEDIISIEESIKVLQKQVSDRIRLVDVPEKILTYDCQPIEMDHDSA